MKRKELTKGFCQVKKNPKIREKLGSGWVGGSQDGFVFFWKFCVFLSCFFAVHVSEKKKIGYGSGWVRSGQSEFFSDFFLT